MTDTFVELLKKKINLISHHHPYLPCFTNEIQSILAWSNEATPFDDSSPHTCLGHQVHKHSFGQASKMCYKRETADTH